jgi:hypothetical protein
MAIAPVLKTGVRKDLGVRIPYPPLLEMHDPFPPQERSMRRILSVLACLAVLPSIALAQRGGGGRTQADRHTPMFDKDEGPKGPSLRPRDLEDASPIKLLIDKRKDLKLTDAQMTALKGSESQLKDKNAPLFKAVDSLVHEMKPPMNPSDETRAHAQDAGRSLMAAVRDIRANYDAAAKDIVATFDAEQQTKANEMLAKQKDDADKDIREKMGQGGGRKG